MSLTSAHISCCSWAICWIVSAVFGSNVISTHCVSSHGTGSRFPRLVVWQSVCDATAISSCLALGLLSSPSSSRVVGACWGASCVSSTQSSWGCSCWASSVDNLSLLLGIGTNSGVTHSYLGGVVSGISTVDAMGMVGGTSLLPTLGGIWIVICRGGSASTVGSGGGPPDWSPGWLKVIGQTRTGMQPLFQGGTSHSQWLCTIVDKCQVGLQ